MLVEGAILSALVNTGSDKETLDAIYDYIRNQRPRINEFPGLLQEIQSFESWYQGLGWYDRNIVSKEALDEAKRRRNKLNEVMKTKIPDTWVPADAPQTSPPKVPKPIIPTQYKIGVAVGAGIAAVIAVAIGVRLGLKKLKVIP